MERSHDIWEVLEHESWLAMAFLFCAVLSALLVPISWFSHGRYVYLIIFPLGIAWMIMGLALFLALGKQNTMAIFGRQPGAVAAPLPVNYWWCLGISLIYLLSVFIGYAAISPEGVPLGPTADLRISSAAFLFLNLGGFGFAHSIGRSQRT